MSLSFLTKNLGT